MDSIIQAATVLSAFAAVHERVIELIRSLNQSLLAKTKGIPLLRKIFEWVDGATTNHWNSVFAVVLALATHADLLSLFQPGADRKVQFFELYLHGWSAGPGATLFRAISGCVLMGLSTGLGSQFWHDLAKGLIDVRSQARSVAGLSDTQASLNRTQAVAQQPAPRLPPASGPLPGFVAASDPLGAGQRRMPPAGHPPAFESTAGLTPMIA
jgi:hypothetical protein